MEEEEYLKCDNCVMIYDKEDAYRPFLLNLILGGPQTAPQTRYMKKKYMTTRRVRFLILNYGICICYYNKTPGVSNISEKLYLFV